VVIHGEPMIAIEGDLLATLEAMRACERVAAELLQVALDRDAWIGALISVELLTRLCAAGERPRASE
jgi:hypothetical protein